MFTTVYIFVFKILLFHKNLDNTDERVNTRDNK